MNKNNDDFEDFDDMEDFDDSYEVITIIDENGDEIECFVIDTVEHNGANYLLIIDSEDAEDDEPEAMVLKEVSTTDDDVIYEPVENDDEYSKIISLFAESSSDYDIEG